MNTEVQEHEERHAALMAVASALTEGESTALLYDIGNRWPHLHGATVADVLDYTTDYDMFLDQTEPFFEKFGGQLPQDVRLSAALHVIILLGRELTPGRVWSVLQRAGMADPPRYPDVEAGLIASVSPDAGDGSHLLVKARAEQGMRAAGVPEHEIAEFRAGIRATGIPGYGQNMADIARWVTLVDCYTELPRRHYDPTDDLAVVLAHLHKTGVMGGGDAGVALDNLRSHLDMRAPETVKSSLLTVYGKEIR